MGGPQTPSDIRKVSSMQSLCHPCSQSASKPGSCGLYLHTHTPSHLHTHTHTPRGVCTEPNTPCMASFLGHSELGVWLHHRLGASSLHLASSGQDRAPVLSGRLCAAQAPQAERHVGLEIQPTLHPLSFMLGTVLRRVAKRGSNAKSAQSCLWPGGSSVAHAGKGTAPESSQASSFMGRSSQVLGRSWKKCSPCSGCGPSAQA